MNPNIQAAASMMNAEPAQDSDARHESNVSKAKENALFIFYDKATHEQLMSMIQDGDEAGGAAVVAATLIESIDEKSGGNMPDDVILPAAIEVMADIMDYLEQRRNAPFSDKEHAGAMAALMKKLADDYGTTPEQMKEALQGLNQGELDQADVAFQQAVEGGGQPMQQEQTQNAPQGLLGVQS